MRVGVEHFLKRLKGNVSTSRNYFFSKCEAILILVSKILFPRKRNSHSIITFGSRPGRGLRESFVQGEFLDSMPELRNSQKFHFLYNKAFWLVDVFKLLRVLRFSKSTTLILIQYVNVYHVFPSKRILEEFSKYNTQIVFTWLDTWDKAIWEKRILPVLDISTKNIVTDIKDNPIIKNYPATQFDWFPIPIVQYPYVPFPDRRHKIFYSGGVSNDGIYKSRGEYLAFLSANNIAVDGISYNRENPEIRPTYHEYRLELSESKIALNFTWKGTNEIITGRTWEIFSSGSLLLQNQSKVLEGLFIEGTHYLSFESEEDLLSKLIFLENNPSIAESIGIAGLEKYNSIARDYDYWKFILGQGEKVPGLDEIY